MKKYTCQIKEFRDITQPGKKVVEYRMTIEVIPKEKKNKPDEKQYRKTYEMIISCHEDIKICWKARGQIISDNDFEKVFWIEGLEYFKREFKRGVYLNPVL